MGTETRPRLRRRSAAALAALATAAALSAFATPVQAEESPGILPEGDWTPEQVQAAEDLVHLTEQVLPEQFGDPSTLEAMGFYNFGATAPGGYDHWINPGWIGDDHLLDPEFPESLVYRHTEDGGYELQAAMFFLNPGDTMDNIPEQYAWYPGWHVHDELCVDDEGRFTGLVGPNGCSSGHPADMPPMMHVWIVDNACGHRFAGIGVSGLMCDEMDHGPDPHEPGPHPTMPEHEEPMPEEPDVPGPPAAPPAPPAKSVPGTPTFTG